MAERLSVGSYVSIQGLQKRPELNGRVGRVTKGMDFQAGRLEVSLPSGEVVGVKVSNLRRAKRPPTGPQFTPNLKFGRCGFDVDYMRRISNPFNQGPLNLWVPLPFETVPNGSLDKAREHAEQALESAPDCADAYAVFAFCSSSLEEALEFYKKGAPLKFGMVAPHEVEECRQDEDGKQRNDCWKVPCWRGWLRCMYGVANTLRKLGKYSEAYEVYQELIPFEYNFYTSSSYVNMYAFFPAVVFMTAGPRRCMDIMRRGFKNADKYADYTSSIGVWTSIFVLCQYALMSEKTRTEFEWHYPDLEEGETFIDRPHLALGFFLQNHVLTIDLLLGDRPFPQVPMLSHTPLGLVSEVVTTAAVLPMWEATEGALEWLGRMRNTYEVMSRVMDKREGYPVDRGEFASWMDHPFVPHAVNHSQKNESYTMLDCLFIMTDDFEPFSRETSEMDSLEVFMLTKLPEKGCPPFHVKDISRVLVPARDSPLMLAAYQGFGSLPVKVLLKQAETHGGFFVDPFAFHGSSLQISRDGTKPKST
uniref:Uncharacterized protein n=1 Tax=Chromera velia CCMP2878 TaxID=1169474 RepID=A0A0G4HT18_9ALVE|eukprot:Cvel_8369.t1-p1 / transcript=Cvel_8369.t1 / gene=Cvel_8369 / organism=Chromera_velia_CCMP2878 / gene_product=hypothetical protein / transcript_product=hypothetical protein / location=Cvel_scaffold461:23941-25692(-) / protein_length=531 / sequence_SO=supercontig / SO=protein_coding / is_pseudo=false